MAAGSSNSCRHITPTDRECAESLERRSRRAKPENHGSGRVNLPLDITSPRLSHAFSPIRGIILSVSLLYGNWESSKLYALCHSSSPHQKSFLAHLISFSFSKSHATHTDDPSQNASNARLAISRFVSLQPWRQTVAVDSVSTYIPNAPYFNINPSASGYHHFRPTAAKFLVSPGTLS